jgi:primosomal protein N' (replication factor Y)
MQVRDKRHAVAEGPPDRVPSRSDDSPMSRVLQVAVPVPVPQWFDYRVADGAAVPAPGCRVLVPFGAREVVGVVIGVASSTADPADLKTPSRILDREPLLTEELLATLQWVARYYQHPPGEVFKNALPAALRSARALPQARPEAFALTAAGIASVSAEASARASRDRGSRADALLDALSDGPLPVATLDARLPGWRDAARRLRARGLVAPCAAAPGRGVAGPELNGEQRAAVDAVLAVRAGYAPFVLDGVTGSGKTEVYLRLVADCLARGRQALVLVPEIALTAQIIERFRTRLGVPVAALHSGLGETERARAWLAAASGETKVVLGTRSAIFVPLPHAGLLVVDEEHDASYKQQDGLRYHARDLALVRAKALRVPILLGSATPSLETLANVEAGRYRRLRLAHRAGEAKPPRIDIVDLRAQTLRHGLAKNALDAIGTATARGEQVLVFRNRRGYAPVLLCHDCGWSAKCVHCDRPLTLHGGARSELRCHHCGARATAPRACPRCGGLALHAQGHGTERLEEALVARFPGVPVLRIDRDTTRGRRARDALFDRIHAEGALLLVGTQILAKGHDLPRLALVVVVGVDEGLYSVDFRAAERLGQLVVQVAGRAGRARAPGRVLLQTHHPDHPLLATLLDGGYPALAAQLLAERRDAGLPPFGHLALLRAEHADAATVPAFLAAAIGTIPTPSGIALHGPLPAPMPRRAGAHRGQVLVEARDRTVLQSFLPSWLGAIRALPLQRRVRWSIDVDPIDLY